MATSPSTPANASQPRAGLSPALRGSLAVLTGATLFGLSSTFAQFIFREHGLPAHVLVEFRMTLTSLLLLGVMGAFRPGLLHVPRQAWLPVFLWGVGPLTLTQVTYFYAINATNVATGNFLQYMAPVITALYVRAVLREHLGPRLLLGLGLAVGGAALLVFGDGAGLRLAPLGVAAGLASAALWSWYNIAARGLRQRVGEWALLAWGMGSGALALMVAVPPWRALAHVNSPGMWFFFLYLAVFATALPFGLYLYGLRHLRPTPLLILASTEPVVSTASSWLLLGEALAPLQVAGSGLIIVAVLLVQWLQLQKESQAAGQPAA